MSYFRGKSERPNDQSNMEIQLLIMFQCDFNRGELVEMPITPPYTNILLALEEGEEPFITRPDFRWIYHAPQFPVFIDGYPHRKFRVGERDRRIDALLKQQGFTSKRYSYDNDSKPEARRIHDEIVQDLQLRKVLV